MSLLTRTVPTTAIVVALLPALGCARHAAPPVAQGAPAVAAASAPARPALESLAGFYAGSAGRGMTVTLDGGTLWIEATGDAKQQLVPREGTTYAVGSTPWTAT